MPKYSSRFEQLLTLPGFIELLWRRRWVALAAFVVIFSAAAWFVLTRPDLYQAELKLLVKPTRLESSVNATATGALTDNEVSSEIELFRSRDSLEDAVNRSGLLAQMDPPGDDRARSAIAVQKLESQLAISAIPQTNMIQIGYDHRNPEMAAKVLKVLTENYLAKHLEVHRNQGGTQFFQQQADLYAKQLEQAQQALAQFRQRNQVTMLDPEKQSALQRETELSRTLADTQADIDDARDRVVRLRGQLASLPETIEASSRTAQNQPLVERLKTTLLDLENQRTELLTKYDPSYRLVKEVESKIRDTQAALDKEMKDSVVDRTNTPNPLHQTTQAELLRTEAELVGLQAKRDSTARDLRQARSSGMRLDGLTSEHDDLERAVQLAEQNYLLYKQKLEEARLADALDQQRILNVSVVEDVEVPAVPVERHDAALLVLSSLIALFGSFTTALGVDLARPPRPRYYPRREDLVKTGPQAITDEKHQARPDEEDVAEPVVEGEPIYAGPVTSEPEEKPQFVEDPPLIQAAPETAQPKPSDGTCRELAMRNEYGAIIDYLSSVQGPRKGIAVGLSPEIDATEAAEAAVQMAYSMQRRNGLPVLLVDAAGQARPMANFFGMERASGLHELLTRAGGDEKNCIHSTGYGDLWLLPQGSSASQNGAVPARVQALHRALANRSMNVIVHLPDSEGGQPTSTMFYSVLDAVLSNLCDSGFNGNTTEMIRRVMEAKKHLSENRLTLIGDANEWTAGDVDSLTVC